MGRSVRWRKRVKRAGRKGRKPADPPRFRFQGDHEEEIVERERGGKGRRSAIRQDVGEIEGPPARGSAAAREIRSGGRIQPIPSVRNCSLTFVSQPSPYIARALTVVATPPCRYTGSVVPPSWESGPRFPPIV